MYAENFGVYGALENWAQLNREGHRVARCTPEGLIGDLGLRGAVRDKPRRTTIVDDTVERLREDVVVVPPRRRIGFRSTFWT